MARLDQRVTPCRWGSTSKPQPTAPGRPVPVNPRGRTQKHTALPPPSITGQHSGVWEGKRVVGRRQVGTLVTALLYVVFPSPSGNRHARPRALKTNNAPLRSNELLVTARNS